MSYLVLARKYRPQTFDDVVGQKHVTQTLTNAIKIDRISHAFLFTGTRGVGKTTAARLLAKALNCEHGPTPTPCNECANCVSITKGNSVDVFEIDGASNTSVDDVRDLRENVRFMPQHSRFKIYIIDEVHMLSNSAFNALLKTLEEPPDHVVFIFATTEHQKIPETVLSRVQQYDFKMIPQKAIYEHLKKIVAQEDVDFDDSGLMLIARKAEGSMRDALSYLDQAISFGGDKVGPEELREILGVVDRQLLLDLSAGILSGDSDKTLTVVERLSGVAWDVKQLYGDLLEHFRNLVVCKLSKDPTTMIDTTDEEISALKAQAETTSLETLQRLFNVLVENEDVVLRSTYPNLVLEMTLLRMAYAAPVASLDELVGQLASLKESIGQSGGPAARPFPKKENVKPETKPSEIAPPPAIEPPEDKPENKAKPKTKKAPKDLAKSFIKALKKSDAILASIFEDSKLVEKTETTLTYSIEKGFMYNKVEEGKDLIDNAIAQAGGEKVLFIQGKASKSTNELAELEKKRKQKGAKLAQLRKDSRKHPLIAGIIEQFEDPEIAVAPIEPENK